VADGNQRTPRPVTSFFRGKRGIEPGITRFNRERHSAASLGIVQPRFRKITEALEDDAVSELPRVPDQQVTIKQSWFSRYALRLSATWSMPPPTSGAAIISTSVRAGSDIDTFTEPRHRVFNPKKRFGFTLCNTKTAPWADHGAFLITRPRSEDQGPH